MAIIRGIVMIVPRQTAGIVAVGATCDGAPIFANKQEQLSAAWLGPSHVS
ncbi:MAG TPA: hypothetical protein VGC99_22195 [Candidatus Tectomicrobia bacterium]